MTAPAQVGPSPVGGGPAVSADREEFLADVGDRIRAERHARGWTQDQLGRRSGLSRKAIEHMEHGRTSMPLLGLADVCRGLGVTLSALLSESWEMPTAANRERGLTPRQAHILRVAASTGLPLSQVAARVGTTRQVVAARLSESYRLLGVAHLPQRERRAAAVRVAEDRGLFNDRHEVDAA
ncbi:helix-turn-helix domain-containing protein [Streptomyces sp. NPDC058239]|uniref:helix-turn-helix domain-containing protein n=1 Tax=Streptomyces sp. NPDC058239 TaxID=3346395 RepID=UPI0036E67F5B